MAYEWDSFLTPADEWIVEYSLPPALPAVKPFAIGHAVELYLKAAYAKCFGNMDRAIGFGHRVANLLRACQDQDPAFLAEYRLRDDVLNAPLFQSDVMTILSRDDMTHFMRHQELYMVCLMLPDLDYLGAPLRSLANPRGGAHQIGFIHPNPYWLSFFCEVRDYIGHPTPDRTDIIAHYLNEGDLPRASAQYLTRLYSP